MDAQQSCTRSQCGRIVLLRDRIALLPVLAIACALSGWLVFAGPAAATQLAGKIAVNTEPNGVEGESAPGDIYMMNADGTARTHTSEVTGTEPVWSPNGQQIAFSRSNAAGGLDLYKLNADGSSMMRLTNNQFTYSENANWSPNGKRIAFAAKNADGSQEIHTIKADGTGEQRLTPGPGDCQPDYSPDGKKIVFMRFYDLYVMSEDGTNVVRLTSDGSTNEWPHWSPDGRKIVFHSSRSGDFEIYVMNPNGKDVRQLTSEGGRWPVWSPDGRWIAFQNNFDIYVIHPDGSALTAITSSHIDDFPSWGRGRVH